MLTKTRITLEELCAFQFCPRAAWYARTHRHAAIKKSNINSIIALQAFQSYLKRRSKRFRGNHLKCLIEAYTKAFHAHSATDNLPSSLVQEMKAKWAIGCSSILDTLISFQGLKQMSERIRYTIKRETRQIDLDVQIDAVVTESASISHHSQNVLLLNDQANDFDLGLRSGSMSARAVILAAKEQLQLQPGKFQIIGLDIVSYRILRIPTAPKLYVQWKDVMPRILDLVAEGVNIPMAHKSKCQKCRYKTCCKFRI